VTPPEETQVAARPDEQLYCYGHPDTPTRLRCSRCDRPICGRCAIPASVGQHCPECVAEARRSAPKVRATLQANAPAVYAIIVITVIGFVLQQVSGDFFDSMLMVPFLIDLGEYWRLLTPVLLHGGVIHIFFNMYILYIYGQDVEQAFGTARFLVIYVGTAITASSLSYALPPDNPSLGASGAVFGVAGALIAYLYNRRTSTFASHHLRGMMTFLAINFALGFMIPRIDWVAHLGGLVGGIMLGLAFDEGGGAKARSNPVRQTLLIIAVAVATFLLIASR
jgi:membrane associated rhomboid family serine protease